MPNEKNLIPNSERTPQERREIAAAGGRASGVSRRRKKSLKATMRAILDLPVGKADYERLADLGIPVEEQDNQTLMLVGLFRAAADGDVKAVREIRSILQEQLETPLEAKERKLRNDKAAAELKALKNDPSEDAVQGFLRAVSPGKEDIKELFADETEG